MIYTDKIRKLLTDSIKLRTDYLNPDKWGLYLSGGIDSSIIACVAKPKKVFSFVFENESYDESKYSSYIANYIKAEHIIIKPTKDDFLNNINNIIYHLDHPCNTMGCFPQYMLAQEANKNNMTIMLSGQGADEMFGGYVRYLICDYLLNSEKFNKQLSGYNELINKASNAKKYHAMYFSLINNGDHKWNQLYVDFVKKFNSNYLDSPKDKMMKFDFVTSLRGLLHVDDRINSAFAIETRSPFLDNNLVQYVFSLSSDIKMKNNNLKSLLKDSFKRIVPDYILDRDDKIGIAVPLNKWIFGFTNGEFSRKKWNKFQLKKWKEVFKL